MSQEERDWLEWLKRARDKKMKQGEAAERMGISQRWVRKLLKQMKRDGDRECMATNRNELRSCRASVQCVGLRSYARACFWATDGYGG
jgi:DNA-binding Lrp family transcriptional regulator